MTQTQFHIQDLLSKIENLSSIITRLENEAKSQQEMIITTNIALLSMRELLMNKEQDPTAFATEFALIFEKNMNKFISDMQAAAATLQETSAAKPDLKI